jgi:hypothetical protein
MARQPWTPEEDEKLIGLIESGVRRYLLPFHFPYRSKASVKGRADHHFPPDSAQKAANCSKALADAINDLFSRMPARVVAEVIGKPHLAPIPGLEPVMYGQLAQRRLAA